MRLKNFFSRKNIAVVVLSLFALSSFTSCHRDGCPGQITQSNTEQVKTC